MVEGEQKDVRRARIVGSMIFAGLSAVSFATRVAVGLARPDRGDGFILVVSMIGLVICLAGVVVLLVQLRR